MRAVFADPKTDFIFVRIFGSEPRKQLLIELLNTLLELEGDRRIRDLSYLAPEQKVPLPEMKLSIVDVKCIDERGREYLVQVQLLNVEGFDERFLSPVTSSPRTPREASTAFAVQLRSSEDCPDADIVGVTICDFKLWPAEAGVPSVPMLSRWRVQEPGVFPSRSSREDDPGASGLWRVEYVFLELPKYEGGSHPRSPLDKWTYFFREAENLDAVPPELDEPPFREAFQVARVSGMTPGRVRRVRPVIGIENGPARYR